MFEKILERILKKYLAPYIDGISRDGLSILKGDLSLQNLQIKAAAFDFLKPYGILLKSGRVGRLHIQIPWRQLTQGKITIELECISAAVARIQGEVPDDATILWDNWQSKIAKIEKKAQELQDLAENAGGDENSGMLGRFMHRLAQNIQVAVGGGVMLQGFDTKQALSGGLLLEGLRVMSEGEASPDEKVPVLQKRIEITDIGAYITVDDGTPRYMLEPTRLVLTVNHRATNLEAKLELLERETKGSRNKAHGCRLAVSQKALTKLAISFREMGAWSSHCQEVISRHCQHVKTDHDSLIGETYKSYTQLYRRKQAENEVPLSREEENELQAIEEAVMSRHLARWRIEVAEALKKKKTTRRGLRGLFGGGGGGGGGQIDRNSLIAESDKEWEDMRKQIRDDQAHLADLDRPQTVDVAISLQNFLLQVYDDSLPGGRFESIVEGGGGNEEGMEYYDLVGALDNFDVGSVIRHDLRLELRDPQTTAKVTPKVYEGYERSEWSFGVCVGTLEVWCDQNSVMRYISAAATKAAAKLEGDQFKDIVLSSRIRDDGTEMISANINLPPIELYACPEMVGVAASIFTIDLPEPPTYGKREKTMSESRAEEEEKEWYNLHGTYWEEWNDEFSQWKKDVVFETGTKQAERVKDSSLVFDVDLTVAAPQLTVAVAQNRRIHVDLGRLLLKSDGELKADDFKVKLELKDTQVTCVAGVNSAGEELKLTVLAPISLEVLAAGKKTEGSCDLGGGTPLDLDLSVQLRRFEFDVYPQAVHLILEVPKVYMAVLDTKEDKLPARRKSSAASMRRSTAGRLSRMSVDLGRARKSTAEALAKKEPEPPAEEASSAPSPYTVRAKAEIELISLGLFDLDLDRAARIDVAGLRAGGSSKPTGAIAGNASMNYFLIEARGQPLLQLQDQREHGDALIATFGKQAEPPMTVSLSVCPVLVEWRKEHVKGLIAAAASCAAPAPPGAKHDSSKDAEVAEATLNQLSEALETRVKERRGSVTIAARRSLAVVPRKSTVNFGTDDASRQVAKNGLMADGELPALSAERGKVAAPAMAADVKFGGLQVKLFRDEASSIDILPIWRQKSNGPLVELHVVGLTAKHETFDKGEARCKVALDSVSILYDGDCIISPWSSSAKFFEADLRMYQPVDDGGPLHSVCFRGLLRKLSIVFFKKHIGSITDYLSSNITGALVQEASEASKEAVREPKATDSVALWNVFIESPVIYLPRDEHMLRYSPAWDPDAELLAPAMAKPAEADAGEDDEFKDAAEHPTPMVEELPQYISIYPGSIMARNTFEADGTSNPPSFFHIDFSQTNLDGVDRVGPASGNIIKIDDWQLLVRLDGATPELPMHVSVGLQFKPISCFLSPERLRLILDCLQENVSHMAYFPQPVVMAPAGAKPVAGPSFAAGHEEEMRVQNMSLNLRISFEGLNVSISRLPQGVAEAPGAVYEPLLGLAIGQMRLLVDCVLFYDNVPPAVQLGVFLSSVTADDLRPAEARASVLSTRLLELKSEGVGFCDADGNDAWIFLPDREQGKGKPPLPDNAALFLLFVMASASSSSCRFELRRPKIYVLQRLCAETGAAMGGGFNSSSMAVFPGPPIPDADGQPLAAPAPPEGKNLAVRVAIQEASVSMYTSYVRAAAPVVQVMVSLGTELDVGDEVIRIKDVSLSDLQISRTEVMESEAAVGKQPSGKASTSSVQLFLLTSLNVAGDFRKLPRKELEMKVGARPASVRLTTGDVPHLVAAFTGLGGDGPAEEAVEQAVKEEDTSAAEAERQGVAAPELPRHGRQGVLRLLVRGVSGAQTLEGLYVTASFGDGKKPIAVPWGKPLLLSVPPISGLGGSHKRVADGPSLQLTLHGPGGAGAAQGEVLGTMAFPAELCAGRGLDGKRFLLAAAPYSDEAARALRSPAVAGRRQLELDLQAHYEPDGADNAVALGILALSAAVESFDDFIKPCETLEDFLSEAVPRLGARELDKRKSFDRRKSARSSTAFALRRQSQRRASFANSATAATGGAAATAAMAPKEAEPPLAIRVAVAMEGLEASFLDDCQAHVLPVLKFHLRAGRERRGSRGGPSQAANDVPSGINFEMNPWGAKGQQLGMSLGVKNYIIGVSYLNARAGCWEPFLEPWGVDFFYSAYPDLEHAGVPGKAQTPALSAKYHAATEITLMSFGPLNLNVTPQLCSLASFLLSNKEAYIQRLESPGTAVEAGGARYRLLNMASAPVCLAVIQPGQQEAVASGQEPLDWRVFEPDSAEVPLDNLLGHRTSEEWRLMADETLACLVGLLPPGGVGGGGAPRDPLRVLLSSTCEGLLTVPTTKEHAACEVLLPHPSHHLMLITGRTRVFNHTGQALEVRFQLPGAAPPAGAQPASAAPMHVLPERLAFPPEIAAALRPGMDNESEASLAPIRKEPSTPHPGAAGAETGPVPGAPDAQRLPQQHFCSAPLWAAGSDGMLQMRLAGSSEWSEPVPVTASGPEDSKGKAVLVPGANGAVLRLHCYRSRNASPGGPAHAGSCLTSLHVCTPLRLQNATPVRLGFSFSPESANAQKPMTVEVDAFSDYDVSSELDPGQAFSLSLALADTRVNASSGGASSASSGQALQSTAVPNIFDSSQAPEELVPVPLGRAGGATALGMTVSRGLAVRASCGRWLVDRTGLGLRALCTTPQEVPSADCAPLAQVDGHITLLDCVLPGAQGGGGSSRNSQVSTPKSNKKGQPESKYYLAVPGSKGWSDLAPAKLPDEESGFVRLALTQASAPRTTAASPPEAGYALHVCLQSEAASSRLTFGAQCQVISVLPQVIIYNQLTDDALVVRAVGDWNTEISVPPQQSRGFLRWRGEAEASSGKSPLAVQFRPEKLGDGCGWSTPIGFGVEQATGPMALSLPPAAAQPRSKSTVLEMFTAEVAERSGVMSLTVKRGSRCELQNYSCLVETLLLRRTQGNRPNDIGEQEEFSARSYESVEFAWSTVATEGQLEVALSWSSSAGGSSSRGPAPDFRKPGHVVFPAPDGWQAVLVETGTTGSVCWMRVQDIIWTTLTDSECKKLKTEGTASAQLKVILNISHLGLSLVSPKREQELLYAEIRNAAAVLGKWDSSVSLDFTLTDLQVDCQLLDYKDCPVVFANRAEPALQCKVIQQLPASTSGVGLDILGVRINALELSVNESFLSEVGEAVSAMLRPILSLEELGTEKIEAWRTAPLGGDFEVPPPTPSLIDISQFHFLGLDLRLWASIRLSKLPIALRGALGVLTVGSDRLSIQGATLQLDQEVFDNIHGPAPMVAKMILQRYWGNLLMSLASLLGRSTLLELPSLPVKWGRRGVESGMNAVNFLLTRTANVFEMATLDKQYVRQKRPLLGQQIMEVTNLATGVGAAGQHLAEGVMHVGDIVREPIEGARSAGAKGFAMGVKRGMMGTVVEPVLGVVHSVSSLAKGVKLSVKGDEGEGGSQRKVTQRRRPPRVMYSAGAIREYIEAQPVGAP